MNGFKNEKLDKKSPPTQQPTKSKVILQAKPIVSTSRIQNNGLSNKVG